MIKLNQTPIRRYLYIRKLKKRRGLTYGSTDEDERNNPGKSEHIVFVGIGFIYAAARTNIH